MSDTSNRARFKFANCRLESRTEDFDFNPLQTKKRKHALPCIASSSGRVPKLLHIGVIETARNKS